MSGGADHWDGIYSSTPVTEVSWYTAEPSASLRLVEKTASSRSAAVIDVGAGASLLVDRLGAHGYTDVTILDISRRALTQVRERLGSAAPHVTFVHQDVLTWQPDRQYDTWHD